MVLFFLLKTDVSYAAGNKAPDKVEAIDEFIIYLDISQFHSKCIINFNNLSKVLDLLLPSQNVQVVTQGGQGKQQEQVNNNVAVTAIDKMLAEFKNLNEHKREKKYEALVPYDPNSQKDCP